MSNELKLICPWCQKEFITKRRTQLWCSHLCRDKMALLRKRIKDVEEKQDFMAMMKDYMCYDLEKDGFYFRAIKQTEKEL